MLTATELDRLAVVLIGTRNPLNIGAAARAMSNFGSLHLRVVRPWDPAFREARSAVDAEPVLLAAQSFENVAPAVADFSLVVGTTDGSRRHLEEPLQPLAACAESIRQHLRSGSRVAILFGSEKTGLSNQDLSHCQLLLRIPTRAAHSSMNLGQAVAVVLYELIRDPEPASAEAAVPPLSSAGERERFVALLLEALSLSGCSHQPSDSPLEDKLRRLVRRLSLTQPDLHEWLGLLRQILWKLRTGKADVP